MTAQTISQAVATRDTGITKIMWGYRVQLDSILPDHIDVKGFIGTAAAALYADEDLMKAAQRFPDSLITTLMRCAALGHRPGTDEFYLHIRKGKVSGTEGYRGVIERMYRSGAVAKVVVREVCAADQFSFVEGIDDRPRHEIGGRGATGADFFGGDGSRARGPMVGVYAYAELTTGAVSRVAILDRDDVMAARESSDAKDSKYSPWNRLDGGAGRPELTGRSMWWKTAAKRLEPWVPTSAEYRREQLRAAASASIAAAAALPVPNGHAGTAPPHDIVDAEVVGEHDAPGPAPVPGRPAGQEPAAGPEDQEPDETGYDTPGTVTKPQLTKIAICFQELGFASAEREQRLTAASQITGRELATGNDLSRNEAKALIDTLERCDGSRERLIALLAQGESPDGEAGDG